ncbi:MAG TPA: hypothetical protein VGJ20_34465 [Xanthobacteraceae bacterium]|jgi:hypothetical protein
MSDANEDLHQLNLRMLGQVDRAIDDLVEIRDKLRREGTSRMMATKAIMLFWIVIAAIWGGAIWALSELRW